MADLGAGADALTCRDLWLALVTPTNFEIGRHLIEGLKNPMVVRDQRTLDVLVIRPMGIREAIQRAIAKTKGSRPP